MPEFPQPTPLPAEPGELDRVLRRARCRRGLKAAGGLGAVAGLVTGAVLVTGPGSQAQDDVLEVIASPPTAASSTTASATASSTAAATAAPSTTTRPPVAATPSPRTSGTPTRPATAPTTTSAPYVNPCQPFLGRAVTPDGRPLSGVTVTDVSLGGASASTTAADGSFGPLFGYRAQVGGGQGPGAPNVVPRQIGGEVAGPIPTAQVDTLCAEVDAQGRPVRKDVVLEPGAVLQGTITAPSCLGIDPPQEPFYQYYETTNRIHVLTIAVRRVDAHTLSYRVQGLPRGTHQGSFEVLSYPVTDSSPRMTLDHPVRRLPASVGGVYTVDIALALEDLRGADGKPAPAPESCRPSATASPAP